MPKLPELLQVPELADFYDRSPYTIRKWSRLGMIPGAFRKGGSWFYKKEAVLRDTRKGK